MSVYREALDSGRLLGIWAPADGPAPAHRGGGTRQSLAGIRRAVREAKRLEAEDSAETTPYWRTKASRRAAA